MDSLSGNQVFHFFVRQLKPGDWQEVSGFRAARIIGTEAIDWRKSTTQKAGAITRAWYRKRDSPSQQLLPSTGRRNDVVHP
jgi:hypothetical protein